MIGQSLEHTLHYWHDPPDRKRRLSVWISVVCLRILIRDFSVRVIWIFSPYWSVGNFRGDVDFEGEPALLTFLTIFFCLKRLLMFQTFSCWFSAASAVLRKNLKGSTQFVSVSVELLLKGRRINSQNILAHHRIMSSFSLSNRSRLHYKRNFVVSRVLSWSEWWISVDSCVSNTACFWS